MGLTLMLVGSALAQGLLVGSLTGKPSPGVLYALGAHTGSATTAPDWFRLLLGTLLHASPLHLTMNLSMVMALGPLAEARLGSGRTLVLFGVSGLAGGASLLGADDTVSVGSSALACGLFGAVLAMMWRLGERIPRGYRLGFLGVLLTVFALEQALVTLESSLTAGAHVAGFAAGGLTAWILEEDPGGTSSRRPAPSWIKALAAIVVATYAVAPLLAWHHVASGRACVATRSGWSPEAARELREGLRSLGVECPERPRGGTPG